MGRWGVRSWCLELLRKPGEAESTPAHPAPAARSTRTSPQPREEEERKPRTPKTKEEQPTRERHEHEIRSSLPDECEQDKSHADGCESRSPKDKREDPAARGMLHRGLRARGPRGQSDRAAGVEPPKRQRPRRQERPVSLRKHCCEKTYKSKEIRCNNTIRDEKHKMRMRAASLLRKT